MTNFIGSIHTLFLLKLNLYNCYISHHRVTKSIIIIITSSSTSLIFLISKFIDPKNNHIFQKNNHDLKAEPLQGETREDCIHFLHSA